VSFNLAAAALAFLALFLAASRFPSVAELLVVWVGVFLGARWLLFGALARATVHRGMLHSLPAAAFFGLLTTAAAHRGFGVEAPAAWTAGSFVAGGYLVHLLLDEAYAVNLFGARTRRSLGSALKLWSRRGAGATLALYLATALALALSPSPGSFARALADPALAARIERHLWPAEGWFSGSWEWLLRMDTDRTSEQSHAVGAGSRIPRGAAVRDQRSLPHPDVWLSLP
jgi:hypothetical protein